MSRVLLMILMIALIGGVILGLAPLMYAIVTLTGGAAAP